VVFKIPLHSTKRNKNASPADFSNKDVVLKIAILWLIFLAAHAFIVFLAPSHSSGYDIFDRAWGLNNISYFSLPWILLFYLVNVVVCIPAVNEKIYKILEQVVNSKPFRILGSRKFIKMIVFILIGLGSIGIFWFFKIKYNFLGDMDIRVQQTVKQEFVDTEALTMFVMYQIYRLLNSWGGLTGIQAFQWVSYFAGGAFVTFTLFLSDELVQGKVKKLLFFLSFICFGTIQMFFGYVEVYCLPAFSVLVYLYTGVLYIKSRVPIVVPVIALLAAIGLHVLSVALLPSLGVLLLYRKYERLVVRGKITIFHFISFLAISIPILYILAPKLGVDYFLVPFVKSQSTDKLMTLFSLEHLWEFFNSQMLAGGIGFILFFIILGISLKKKMKYDMTMWFFATGGLGMLFLAFITNAVRGSGDWDILAFPSLVYNIFGIYVVLTGSWPKPEALRFRYIVPMFLVFNMMSTIAWIGINASDKSITKIEHMIIGDPGNYYQLKLPDELALAFDYNGNGLEEKAMEYFKEAYDLHRDNYVAQLNYAGKLLEHNEPENGITILEHIISIHPLHPAAYKLLMDHYTYKADILNLFLVVNKAFDAYLQRPDKFKSHFGDAKLKEYFIFLRNFENNQGNKKRVQLIDQILTQL
jgi:hypothetical protein